MSAHTANLAFEDKIHAGDLLYISMLKHRETGIKWIALGLAIVIHAVVLLIQFPEFEREIAIQRHQAMIVVKKYIPPPPRIERKQLVKKKTVRKVPIPDPTPGEPEPIREPDPEVYDDPLLVPADVELLIGVPEPPPPPPRPEVLIAGVGGVTNPVLIQESKISPKYPEMPRLARIQGRVILQARIETDGSVGALHVLRCNRSSVGFEEAALDAVRQWHYEPATQNGRNVAVYFTVVVDFVLKTGEVPRGAG